MTLPVSVIILIIVIDLIFLVVVASDLANATNKKYSSKVGYNKPIGWISTAVMLVILVVLMGVAGQGPLAGVVTVAH